MGHPERSPSRRNSRNRFAANNDLALLATAQIIEAKRLRAALKETFAFRKTHSLPMMLPEPLPAWETPYAAMARADQLAGTSRATSPASVS